MKFNNWVDGECDGHSIVDEDDNNSNNFPIHTTVEKTQMKEGKKKKELDPKNLLQVIKNLHILAE